MVRTIGGPKLRMKAVDIPLSTSRILGDGIDVKNCPDGHISCPICRGYKFECWSLLDSRRIEIGCVGCNWSSRILLPIDVDLSELGAGRYTCKHHADAAMVIINNSGKLCIGCEKCRTQVVISLKTEKVLIA